MFDLIKKDLAQLTDTVSFKSFIKKSLSSIGFQVVIVYRASSYCRQKKLIPLSIILDKLMFYIWGAEIRSTARIGGGLTIAHPSGIVIGGKVVIGENLSIRQNTTIGGNTGKHRKGVPEWTQPILGNNILVGCNTAILGPIKIDDNALLGACSLIIKDVGDNQTWGGRTR